MRLNTPPRVQGEQQERNVWMLRASVWMLRAIVWTLRAKRVHRLTSTEYQVTSAKCDFSHQAPESTFGQPCGSRQGIYVEHSVEYSKCCAPNGRYTSVDRRRLPTVELKSNAFLAEASSGACDRYQVCQVRVFKGALSILCRFGEGKHVDGI